MRFWSMRFWLCAVGAALVLVETQPAVAADVPTITTAHPSRGQ